MKGNFNLAQFTLGQMQKSHNVQFLQLFQEAGTTVPTL